MTEAKSEIFKYELWSQPSGLFERSGYLWPLTHRVEQQSVHQSCASNQGRGHRSGWSGIHRTYSPDQYSGRMHHLKCQIAKFSPHTPLDNPTPLTGVISIPWLRPCKYNNWLHIISAYVVHIHHCTYHRIVCRSSWPWYFYAVVSPCLAHSEYKWVVNMVT